MEVAEFKNPSPPAKTGQSDIVFLMSGKKPVCCIENLRRLLDFHGIIGRYNVISKKDEYLIPQESYSSERADESSIARIADLMKVAGLSTQFYREFLGHICEQNPYNPVLEWVLSKPWDGKSRLGDLCNTIIAKHEKSKNLFIRRWLITAMYMAMHDGSDAAGCLVLQGGQGIGKTTWFRKLCPVPGLVRTDAMVDPKNRDSVSQVIRHWIVELGELGSTFRRADIDALKAFITSPSDVLRRPYGAADIVYPRRTALAASVNDEIFLSDSTGNRRYLTIPCIKVDSYHNIDMQQLWAEIYHIIETENETPRLTKEELHWVAEINSDHMQIEPIEEMIIAEYEWGENGADAAFGGAWKSATKIGQEIGLRNISQKETRIISRVVRDLNKGNEDKEKKSGGNKFLVPPRLREF